MYTEPEIEKSIVERNSRVYFIWCLNICVDFNLRDSKKMENMKKSNKIIYHNKNIDIHKTVETHSWNPGSKTGFHNDTLP